MVKIALPLAALAMAASVAAAPAGTSGTTFSFEQWAEDIIANPDTALTVDEAVAAAEEAAVVGSAGGLQKRAWCDGGWPRAPVCSPRASAPIKVDLMLTSSSVCIGAGCCGLRRLPCPYRRPRRHLQHAGQRKYNLDVPYRRRRDCELQRRGPGNIIDELVRQTICFL
jgi:hypothetical protein